MDCCYAAVINKIKMQKAIVIHSDILAMANAGKRAVASNFSLQGVDLMLNSIEDKLPIGSDEWESMA